MRAPLLLFFFGFLSLSPLVVAPGCNVDIACDADDDCPGDRAFCVDSVCAAAGQAADGEGEDGGEGEEGEGEGEGDEGEGEGACDDDGDCGDGLCFTDDTLAPALANTCFPGAGENVACDGAVDARDVGAPALAVVSLAVGAACTPGPELTYTARIAWRDAAGDVDDSGFGLRVTAPGGQAGNYDLLWDANAIERAGSGGSGTATFVFCAFAGVDQLGLQLFDDVEHGSNVVCAAP